MRVAGRWGFHEVQLVRDMYGELLIRVLGTPEGEHARMERANHSLERAWEANRRREEF